MLRTAPVAARLAIAALALLLSSTAFAGLLNANSKYRKVENDRGNCIFSTGGLPYQKEDQYTGVGATFSTASRPVEVRCYFPQQIQDYLASGKFWNELRDDNNYYNYLTVEPPGSGPLQFESLGVYHNSAARWRGTRCA